MKIQWLGHSCFDIILDDGRNIIIDPYKNILGYKLPSHLTANIVVSSHGHNDHNYTEAITGDYTYISTVGKYKIGNIEIEGIKSYHDNQGGSVRGDNIIFKITYNGISICHCGDLGHTLNQDQTAALRGVDILLVPCGGGYTVGSTDAAIIVSQLLPSYVIPMHYRTTALGPLGFKFESVKKFKTKLNIETLEQKSFNYEPTTNRKLVILDYK